MPIGKLQRVLDKVVEQCVQQIQDICEQARLFKTI